MDKDIFIANKIAEKVEKSGGKVFYVGGCVRDEILGRECKDYDIEIHGITIEALEKILDSIGERLTMGASFEIMQLRHCGLDISLSKSKNLKDAAERRDLTMNALMKNVLTGEILDFFGGLDDIRNKIIRHVNDFTFAEDPLRVFRAARFSACLNFEIAEETLKFSSKIDVSKIAPERIFCELERVLLKSPKPSIFFTGLKEMNQLSLWFSELENFNDFEFIDVFAKLKNQASEPLFFMLAALCLKINDPEKFLLRLTNQTNLIKYVINMKEQFAGLQNAFNSEKSLMKILDGSVCPDDLVLMSDEKSLANILKLYKFRMSQPYLTGKDLISAGFKPGLKLGEALKFAHELRLEGESKDEQLRKTLYRFMV